MLDKNQIIALLKEKGPLLPVEISKALGVDSFMSNAYLSELSGSGEIKKSEERVGSSPLYYLFGQESATKAKIDDLNNSFAKTARTFMSKEKEETQEIREKREQFAKRFEKTIAEIEKENTQEKKRIIPSPKLEPIKKPEPVRTREPLRSFDPPKSEPMKLRVQENIKSSNLEQIKQEIKQKYLNQQTQVKPMPQPVAPSLEKVSVQKTKSFVDNARQYLTGNGSKIIDEIAEKKTEASLVIAIPSPLGEIKFYCKVRDKKKINEADLSLAYIEGLNRKLPTLFLTNGQLAATAKEYAEKLYGLLKVKII